MNSTPGIVYPKHLEKIRENRVANRNEKSWDQAEQEFYASDARYTRIFFNRLPGKNLAKFIIFCVGMMSGFVMGMVKSIYLSLIEAVENRSILSMYLVVYFPLSYKMFCAPMVDLFYIKKLGKCKTYLVILGFLLAAIWYGISDSMDSLIQKDGVIKLTIIWYLIFQTLVIYQSSSDIFLLKISPDVTKGELSMFADLGAVLGEFLTYNIFVPLNSVKFLNTHFFTEYPLAEPLVTYKHYMILMATFALLLSIGLLLFIGERVIEHNTTKLSCSKFSKIAPRFFTRAAMVKLILYIIGTRVFRFLVNATVYPKLSELKFSKANIANVDTVIFPVYFSISYFILKKLMIQGHMMKMNHIVNTICVFLCLLKYFIILDLQANHNQIRTFWTLATVLFIERFVNRPVYLLGFITTIAPLEIGSTFVGLFMSINIACQSYPTSLGVWLLGNLNVSYHLFALVPLGIQFTICGLTTKYALDLDGKDKEE